MVRTLLLVCAVVAVVFVLSGTAVLADVQSVPGRATDAIRGSDGGAQSAAQISPSEFIQVRRGASRETVRGLLGEPEDTSETRVEGLALECWVYGIAGASGAFQLCFENGRLSSRFRYG